MSAINFTASALVHSSPAMPPVSEEDRARDALWAIPPDLDRNSWVKIAMGAHAAGLSLAEFSEWSSGADSYNATDCRTTWNSIKPGAVTEASLFHIAREHGWKDKTNGQRYIAPQAPKTPQERTAPPPAPSVPHARAEALWSRCEPLSVDHGYVIAKSGLTAGLRQLPDDDPLVIAGQQMAGRLVIPARNADGQIQSLQLIPAPGAGKKLNLPDAKISGCYFAVGDTDPGPVYLVEGLATAWAIHRATGSQALCCFGFSNIRNVGRVIRSREKDRALVIAPDAGLEGQAQRIAADVGASVARMPDGEARNFDAWDYAQREGVKALASLLDGATQPPLQEGAQEDGQDDLTPPDPDSLIATESELAAARLTPKCIVRDHSYADVAQVIAPGGTGKTTMLIHESVHIALGRPVWGLPVEAPGWTLVVTAEDRRERLVARLREILASLALTDEERRVAIRGFRVWDVSGLGAKLVEVRDGNVILTGLADSIVKTYAKDPPAVIIFDPLVSFGASEQMINDNEQGIITAARRMVNGLDCCVRIIHHTGKANAREATLDQYSGRGGSAMADGSRMTSVLATWAPGNGNRTPPLGCTAGPGVSVTILNRAKLSYSPPGLPLIWIRREGFAYEAFTEQPAPAPEVRRREQSDQLERFIASELEQERRYTTRSLDSVSDRLGMARGELRDALDELRVSGRIWDAALPKSLCQGSRKTYLAVRSNCADPSGAVGEDLDT